MNKDLVRKLMEISRTMIAFALLLLASAVTHAQPAGLDDTFAGNGQMIRPFTGNHTFEQAEAIAVQGDGKVVVALACKPDAINIPNLCVYRLNKNGTPDSSFAGGATVVTNTKADWYSNAQFNARIALQSTGRIVIATPCRTVDQTLRICVTRLNSNGSIDSSFGTAGLVTTLIAQESVVGGVVIDAVDRIVVAGSCLGVATNYDFCLARYAAGNGAPDPTFGSNGQVVTTFAVGQNADERIHALAISPRNHDIIVAGRCPGPHSTTHFCVARYRSDGSLRTTFGSNGIVYGSPGGIPSNNSAVALALQLDEKIVVGGQCDNAICLMRWHANGSVDTTLDGAYGSTGISRLSFPETSLSGLKAIALQRDGSIIVLAGCLHSAQQNGVFCMTRLWPEGYVDTSFNYEDAYVYVDVSVGGWPTDVAVAHDGRIYAAGSCRPAASSNVQQSCVYRFLGGPYMYSACSFDVDGDGVVTAQTDGVIWLRAMLGFRESRLLPGVTIAPGARRTTSSEIRDFLLSHCGIAVSPN